MRAVLDTNVLVSALLVPLGKPAQILAAALELKFQLILSPDILDELNRVLYRRHIQKRFHPTSQMIQRYVTELLPHLGIVVALPT